MKVYAKDIAEQIQKAVKDFGEDTILTIDGGDILIVKPYEGCDGSGDVLETIHVVEEEFDDDEDEADVDDGDSAGW